MRGKKKGHAKRKGNIDGIGFIILGGVFLGSYFICLDIKSTLRLEAYLVMVKGL